jgi:hypothetical protein
MTLLSVVSFWRIDLHLSGSIRSPRLSNWTLHLAVISSFVVSFLWLDFNDFDFFNSSMQHSTSISNGTHYVAVISPGC